MPRYKHRILGGRLVVRSLFRQGEVWHVRLRDKSTGKVHTRTTGSRTQQGAKEEAQRVAEHLLGELQGTHISPQPFLSAFREWISLKTLRDSTRREYEGCLAVFGREFGSSVTDQIRMRDIEVFLASASRTRSPRTIAKYLSLLRAFFRWSVLRKYSSEDPTTGIKAPTGGATRVGRALSHEAARKLLKLTDGYLKTFALIGLHTGLRRANICDLKWSNVDLERREITVKAEDYKGKRDHTVPVHPELAEYLAKLERKSDLVLGLRIKDPKKGIKKAASKAGFELRLHDLRHSFSTWCQSRFPWAIAEALAGRRITDTGGRYFHPSEEDLRSAIDSLPPLLEAVGEVEERDGSPL